MSDTVFNEKFPMCVPVFSKSSITLKTYTDEKTNVMGEFQVNVTTGGGDFCLPVVVKGSWTTTAYAHGTQLDKEHKIGLELCETYKHRILNSATDEKKRILFKRFVTKKGGKNCKYRCTSTFSF